MQTSTAAKVQATAGARTEEPFDYVARREGEVREPFVVPVGQTVVARRSLHEPIISRRKRWVSLIQDP
jgi:hypothetical protein